MLYMFLYSGEGSYVSMIHSIQVKHFIFISLHIYSFCFFNIVFHACYYLVLLCTGAVLDYLEQAHELNIKVIIFNPNLTHSRLEGNSSSSSSSSALNDGKTWFSRPSLSWEEKQRSFLVYR